MSCSDCTGPTLPFWTRCFECAMRVARRIMSPIPIAVAPVRRKFKKDDPVWVTPKSSDRSDDSVRLAGNVVRRQGTSYVVELLDGPRYYAERDELSEREP